MTDILSPPDPRYAPARDLGDVRERVIRLETSLTHLPLDVRELSAQMNRINAMIAETNARLGDLKRLHDAEASQRDSPMSSLAVAMHRFVERAEADAASRTQAAGDKAMEIAKWVCVIAILALGGMEILGAVL